IEKKESLIPLDSQSIEFANSLMKEVKKENTIVGDTNVGDTNVEDGNLDGNVDTIVEDGNVEDESHEVPKSIEEVVEENESSSVPVIVDEPSQIDQPIEIELPKEVINVPKELPKEE